MLKQRPELTDRISNARRIARFRNILVHAYDLVDHGILWKTVIDDVPVLQREVEMILREDRAR